MSQPQPEEPLPLIPINLLKDAVTMPPTQFQLLVGSELKPHIQKGKMQLDGGRGDVEVSVIPSAKVQELLNNGTITLNDGKGFAGQAADMLVSTYGLNRLAAAV